MKQSTSLQIALKILQHHWGTFGGESLAVVKKNIFEDFSPQHILKIQKVYDLIPLIYKIINADIQLKHITPRPLYDMMQAVYFSQLRRCLHQYNHLSNILQELDSAEVPVMLIKGFALSEVIYNDIGVRPMSDIDLLVPYNDFKSAEKVLKRAGYNEVVNKKFSGPIAQHAFHSQFAKKENGLQIILELHHDLSNKTHPFNAEHYWRRAVQHSFGQNKALIMEPNDLLVYLSLHACRHNFNRILWLCDIAQVMVIYKNLLDWKSLVKISQESKSNIAIFYSIYLVHHLFNIQIPSCWDMDELSVPSYSQYWLKNSLMPSIKEINYSENKMNIMAFMTRLMIAPGVVGKKHIITDYKNTLIYRNTDYLKGKYNIKNRMAIRFIKFSYPLIVLYRVVLEFINRLKT